MDQVSLFKKISQDSNDLEHIKIFPAKRFPQKYIIKALCNSLSTLKNTLSNLQISFKILPHLMYYFATNLPRNMSDKTIQTLICDTYR